MEEPKKRLVFWKQYLHIMGTRTAMLSYAIAVGTVAVTCLVAAAVGFVIAVFHWPDTSIRADCIAFGVLVGIIGLRWLSGVKDMYNRACAIEPVAPITRHNTGHLPEVETLVRGSDRPETAEQAELLRAVRQSPASPPEQLLRATNENRQDV
jgi:hypothetical protein